MLALDKLQSPEFRFYLIFVCLVIIGIYLRLDQFYLQVLLDDEWHAVHQLLQKTPKELFLSIGYADYSIPLALLYFVEAKYFGLSELLMRWPMMLAGIASLFVLPLYMRKRFGDRLVLVFAGLLAISPLLIIYSRTARPYSLTLLFSLLAIAAFYRFVAADKNQWQVAAVYICAGVLSVWLHLISLPLVLAPFLTLGLTALYQRDWESVSRMFWLGMVTGICLLVLLLPPLLAHPQALVAKLGIDDFSIETVSGALFLWFGTSSSVLVVVSLVLAGIGSRRLWRELKILPAILLGLALTLIVMFLSQPAWVRHSLTFARYLLVLMPLLLLALALGLLRVSDWVNRVFGKFGKLLVIFFGFGYIGFVIATSPVQKFLAKPNSNSLHLIYKFDFRTEKNVIAKQQANIPVSQFWAKFSSLPADSMKIAAAPFYFESYNWNAVRWEEISGQRVMPAYLLGLCGNQRWGEVPNNHNYRFKNAGYAIDKEDLIRRGFDFLVFQKAVTYLTAQGRLSLGEKTMNCERKLRDNLPLPVYEDEWLIAFPLSSGARAALG